MSSLLFTEARTKSEVDAVQRYRYDVLVGELEIPLLSDPRVRRDVSSFDNLASSHLIVVKQGGELVATARLALPNREVAAACGTRFGFELEYEFVLERLPSFAGTLAEIARLVVRRDRKGPGVVSKLYEGLYAFSRSLGVTHWIGAVDCQTSRRVDASAMHRLLGARSVVSSEFAITPRATGEGINVHSSLPAPRMPFPSEPVANQGGAEPKLATTITHFVNALAARAIGDPARHPGFPGRFVIPMLVSLDALPKATLERFDQSVIAPPVPVQRAS
jgi:L-ornithine Nalpha-acyltransferase